MEKHKILVVDDEVSVARFLRELFESRGFIVNMVTDSRDALADFQEKPNEYDVVITDQTMPGLTGAEMAMAMLKVRPDIPIILCTGFSEQIDEASVSQMGIKRYFLKPVDTFKLLEAAQDLCA